MTVKARRAAAWVGGAAFCLLAFYLALTRSFEFAVANYVRVLLNALPAPAHAIVTTVLSHLPVDEDPAAWIVRKAASVVFFGIVGVTARIVASRRFASSSVRGWLVVAAAVLMSAAIEAYEWPESVGDITFDLLCGLAGGGLAVLVLRVFRKL